MIGAFQFRLDDYVGRCMIVGFLFSSHNNFPQNIEKVFDMDCETMAVPKFHQELKKVIEEGEGVKYFAFYRNDITDRDGQHDGVPKPITLTLRLVCEVNFDATILTSFLASGHCEDDPPVLEFALRNPQWVGDQKCWGFPFSRSDRSNFTPEEGGILIDDERAVEISFYNDDDNFWNPHFSEFSF